MIFIISDSEGQADCSTLLAYPRNHICGSNNSGRRLSSHPTKRRIEISDGVGHCSIGSRHNYHKSAVHGTLVTWSIVLAPTREKPSKVLRSTTGRLYFSIFYSYIYI
jgi:hypothetical protein